MAAFLVKDRARDAVFGVSHRRKTVSAPATKLAAAAFVSRELDTGPEKEARKRRPRLDSGVVSKKQDAVSVF